MRDRSQSQVYLRCTIIGVLCLLGTLLGCRTSPLFSAHTPSKPNTTLPTTTPTIPDTPSQELTTEETTTLNSLELVDDYPLYTMHFFGNYEKSTASTGMSPQLPGKIGPSQWNFPNLSFGTQATWACSLFVASADSDNRQYGRNFDWEFSPAMLLYTNPTDAYASISMVDITYLGYQGERAKTLSNLSLDERAGLLDAPFLPFDGMNEHGLVVGMAAVPPGSMRPDPDKPTIGSLGVIRKMLDHARNVNEATKILASYNIDFAGGPPIHYLIADASGDAALVEFYQGEMVVLPNSGPWHAATNFLLSSVDGTTGTSCSRYNHINQRMQESGGSLTSPEAMDLLREVSQANTQWSIVYGINNGKVSLAIGKDYQVIYDFHLNPISK